METRKLTNKKNKKFWDFHEIQNREFFKLAQPRLDFLAKKITQLKKEGSVLDIGFGNGYLFKAIFQKNRNFNFFGIDVSEKNIEFTKNELNKLGINVQLKVAEIKNLPFPDNFFDFVITSEVLEHLDSPTLKQGLKEIYRVLKNGGYFLVTVPANENLQDSLCYCPKCGNVFHRWGHKQSFTKENLKKIFSRQLFEVINIKRITFFGERLENKRAVTKMKSYFRKILFELFKKFFAPQWLFFLVAKK